MLKEWADGTGLQRLPKLKLNKFAIILDADLPSRTMLLSYQLICFDLNMTARSQLELTMILTEYYCLFW